MTGVTDSALLNQILATLTNLGERLAVVEADLKTVIRDHTKDLDDHEVRIRVLETATRDVITSTDLDERAAVADRKANMRLVVIGLVMSCVIAGVNIVIAIL
jgi:hypothetical protein